MNKDEVMNILDDLGIDADVTESNGKFTLELLDSDEYQECYSRLSNLDDYELDSSSVIITEETSMARFLNDDNEITISAQFDRDIYKVSFRKVNN